MKHHFASLRITSHHFASLRITSLFIAGLVAIVALGGCANNSVSAYSPITLSNGVTVSAEEQARLESLRPGFIKAITPVIGEQNARALSRNEDVVISGSVGPELEATIRAYMKKTIGDDYEKYLIIDREQKVISIDDPSAASKYVQIPSGSDNVWQYYMVADTAGFVGPWFSRNTAATYAERRQPGSPPAATATGNKIYDVAKIGVRIKDDGTSDTWAYAANAQSVIAYANFRIGVFPPAWGGKVTTHIIEDPSVTGGSISWTHQW
jgi:hypothetical protein